MKVRLYLGLHISLVNKFHVHK